jgi:hypothetical protein
MGGFIDRLLCFVASSAIPAVHAFAVAGNPQCPVSGARELALSATSGRSCCAQYFPGTLGFSPPICKMVVLSSGNHHVHH